MLMDWLIKLLLSNIASRSLSGIEGRLTNKMLDFFFHFSPYFIGILINRFIIKNLFHLIIAHTNG